MAATRTRDGGDIWEEIHSKLADKNGIAATFHTLLHYSWNFSFIWKICSAGLKLSKFHDASLITIFLCGEGELKCDTFHNPQCIVTFSDHTTARECKVAVEEKKGVKSDPIKQILHLLLQFTTSQGKTVQSREEEKAVKPDPKQILHLLLLQSTTSLSFDNSIAQHRYARKPTSAQIFDSSTITESLTNHG